MSPEDEKKLDTLLKSKVMCGVSTPILEINIELVSKFIIYCEACIKKCNEEFLKK